MWNVVWTTWWRYSLRILGDWVWSFEEVAALNFQTKHIERLAVLWLVLTWLVGRSSKHLQIQHQMENLLAISHVYIDFLHRRTAGYAAIAENVNHGTKSQVMDFIHAGYSCSSMVCDWVHPNVDMVHHCKLRLLVKMFGCGNYKSARLIFAGEIPMVFPISVASIFVVLCRSPLLMRITPHFFCVKVPHFSLFQALPSSSKPKHILKPPKLSNFHIFADFNSPDIPQHSPTFRVRLPWSPTRRRPSIPCRWKPRGWPSCRGRRMCRAAGDCWGCWGRKSRAAGNMGYIYIHIHIYICIIIIYICIYIYII